MSVLAVDGGRPVRAVGLNYGRQSIDEHDIAAVADVLRSDWLTTGPKVAEFEEKVCGLTGARYAVAVNSGTAALHAMMHTCGISDGDEVIVPAMTFAATANAVRYCGGTPVFADVDPNTLLLDPNSVNERLSPRTKAFIAVDYAGQPAPYDTLENIASSNGLTVLADACHSLGATLAGRLVGTLAKMTAFSFHPVKPITTGEGGMVCTDELAYATAARRFRNHGIDFDQRERDSKGLWSYEMVDLGYNYRLTDIQSVLGSRQLEKLPLWIKRRNQLADFYVNAFKELPEIESLFRVPNSSHGFHLFVVKLDLERLSVNRDQVLRALRAEGIGANVHYLPVHLHRYYRDRGHGPGLCPNAERAYEQIITLPLFPTMSDEDAQDVVDSVYKVIGAYRR